MNPTPDQAAVACYEAGFAERTITPPVGTSLAGFFHDRVSKCVRDDLFARAAVFNGGNSRIALVALDLICVDADFADKAKGMIAEETGIPTADQVERGAYGSRPIISRWLSADAGRRMIDATLVMLQDLWSETSP